METGHADPGTGVADDSGNGTGGDGGVSSHAARGQVALEKELLWLEECDGPWNESDYSLQSLLDW